MLRCIACRAKTCELAGCSGRRSDVEDIHRRSCVWRKSVGRGLHRGISTRVPVGVVSDSDYTTRHEIELAAAFGL